MSVAEVRGGRFLGSLGEFRRDRLGFLTRLARDQGDTVRFRLGRRWVRLVSHPDDVAAVLVQNNKRFQKHFGLRGLRRFVGVGLLTNEGDAWLRQRRLMQPEFAPRRLPDYLPAMAEQARAHVAAWPVGVPVDMHRLFSDLALAVAVKTLFGTDADGEGARVYDSLRGVLAATEGRFGGPALPRWLPSRSRRRVERTLALLRGEIGRIIDRRRSRGIAETDLLGRLLVVHDERGTMSAQQLNDEVLTLFLAGHGTSANALSWIWMLLATHPDAAKRLRDERDRTPKSLDDLGRMPWTQAVIDESLRLYPPAYQVGREAIEPVELRDGVVPVGETVLMSQWVVHRDPRWWPEAERFMPERWLSPDPSRPATAYFPFGAGPRVCIGNAFAKLEFAVILAEAARRFAFTVADGYRPDPWPAVTLRPRHGVTAVLVPAG